MHDMIAHIKLKSMVQSIPVSPADTITNHVHLMLSTRIIANLTKESKQLVWVDVIKQLTQVTLVQECKISN